MELTGISALGDSEPNSGSTTGTMDSPPGGGCDGDTAGRAGGTRGEVGRPGGRPGLTVGQEGS